MKWQYMRVWNIETKLNKKGRGNRGGNWQFFKNLLPHQNDVHIVSLFEIT